MSVDRSEIADVQTFENVLLVGGNRFQAVAQANQHLTAFFVQQANLLHRPRSLVAQLVVTGCGSQVQQIMLHASHAVVNRHIVVVEDDQQVVGG